MMEFKHIGPGEARAEEHIFYSEPAFGRNKLLHIRPPPKNAPDAAWKKSQELTFTISVHSS